jgi:2-methylcitrate dehydratase PrpD
MDAKVSDPAATIVLAQFAARLSFQELPQVVVSRLKECFLDNIGISAFAAVYAETSGPFRAAAQAMGAGEGLGTVIGESRGYPFAHAAFLNGAYAHTLDFDDTNLVGSLHPGASVVAAAIAAAERTNVDGSELIEALAAGYEVTCRVGAALGPTAYVRGFHITAVAGIFGAVVAAGKIHKMSPAVIANALGLAGSRAAGSMQYLDNGAWNKRLHPGFAAHDALFAIELAAAGVVGASAPLEGRLGLLHGYSNASDPTRLTTELGESWLLVETAIKPYPSCRFAHAAIDLALELRERVPADALAKSQLSFRLSKTAMDIVATRERNKLNPGNIVEAQFSLYFQVAVAWLDGGFDWKSYERIGAPDVVAFMATMNAEVDDRISFAGAQIVVEQGGMTFNEHVDAPLGEPQRPLSWDQLEQKFLSMAGPVYGEKRSRGIAARIRRLEEEPAISDLIRSFRRGEEGNVN